MCLLWETAHRSAGVYKCLRPAGTGSSSAPMAEFEYEKREWTRVARREQRERAEELPVSGGQEPVSLCESEQKRSSRHVANMTSSWIGVYGAVKVIRAASLQSVVGLILSNLFKFRTSLVKWVLLQECKRRIDSIFSFFLSLNGSRASVYILTRTKTRDETWERTLC